MASTLANASLSTARAASERRNPETTHLPPARLVLFPRGAAPWPGRRSALALVARSAPSTPPDIAAKVSESIKKAEEACAGENTEGECAAAWDEVEELSAAASHARDKLKENDPLENYCKDNPETDECRTYED
ncbi:calvin cycle protein CP12-1, chloroplastic-like [Ananas comosus]|uniref:Calvin cycle protein CP12-1, chloroplastic-like n=1 Tax=Ananas comosus TaxID=4615 RepID=A0A199VKT7_ANACO|nr:calvin cycle protein CP12-1, chloroplastic-like [Ananas comosus]OAY77355.1 Calvin cycle protein CP12-2, chloroplastic [Ananas comosus]